MFNGQFESYVPTIYSGHKYDPRTISVIQGKELQEIIDKSNHENDHFIIFELNGDYTIYVDGQPVSPDFVVVSRVGFDEEGYINYIRASWERYEEEDIQAEAAK